MLKDETASGSRAVFQQSVLSEDAKPSIICVHESPSVDSSLVTPSIVSGLSKQGQANVATDCRSIHMIRLLSDFVASYQSLLRITVFSDVFYGPVLETSCVSVMSFWPAEVRLHVFTLSGSSLSKGRDGKYPIWRLLQWCF